MILATLAALAIVIQDQAALRAAPRDSAQQQAVLWQGDTLEVRGERLDYLQVYDHRRERGGYVRAALVRPASLEPAEAPALLAVLRFLRDAPGQEALGIAYAAAYLKAAPAKDIDAEPFDALGSMADRLAARASARGGRPDDPKLSARLDTVSAYGVNFASFERDGRMQTCYDGEAFRQVLALKATPEQQARAALGLTRHECVDPTLTPPLRVTLDQWRAQVLDRVQLDGLPAMLKNRVSMRRAGVWAGIAYQDSRSGKPAADAGQRALDALGEVNAQELADEDRAVYTEAAVRTGASRWAAMPIPAARPGLNAMTIDGAAGQTCVLLTDPKHDANSPLLKRCTYSTVWLSSLSINAGGTAATLAVQPLASWLELWVFRRGPQGWELKVLPPAASDPGIGYAEFAGWVPGGKRLLAAREACVDGHWKRSYEVLSLATLVTIKKADRPESLSTFYRWQSPAWKQNTVSLR